MFTVVLRSSVALQRSRIQVWLYEQVNMRIEGCIIVSTGTSRALLFHPGVSRSYEKNELGVGRGWKYLALVYSFSCRCQHSSKQ